MSAASPHRTATRASAVVVAAGRGVRLGAPDKALLPLAGRPMLAWSLDALQAAAVDEIVVVAGDHTQAAIAQLLAAGTWPSARRVVAGGARRQDSVLAGLRATDPAAEVVVIHDAARPLASPALFDACIAAAARDGAATAAVPVADTLKRVVGDRIVATVDRAGLWAAQTPQAFRRQVLLDLFAGSDDATLTDEAARCEAHGVPVAVVDGLSTNLKVTRPADLTLAEALLRAARSGAEETPAVIQRLPRSGIGYDVHRFEAGRRLVLGGVEIPAERGLAGHSDADVLLHAIADAVLGAAGLGDIGKHFPPGDPRFENADSRELLRESARLTRAAGFVPSNVDATVIAEEPKIGPHADRMRAEIAAALGIAVAAVGVKATTNEGMGFVGRGEGIAALATALLAPLPDGD